MKIKESSLLATHTLPGRFFNSHASYMGFETHTLTRVNRLAPILIPVNLE